MNEFLIALRIQNDSKNMDNPNYNPDSEAGYIYYDIFLIIIGRFFLGMSYLKQLCKIYIDIYIPITNQVQVNHTTLKMQLLTS